MVSLALEVADLANVHNLLVVPSPRRVPTAKEMAAFVARLAPIEMAAPSISSSTRQQANQSGSSREPEPLPHHSGKPLAVQGWAIPLGYLVCGALLFLCSLLIPDGLVMCGHILTPAWTLALVAHALATEDPAWVWLGLLTACLLPFVLLVKDPLFLGFYLLAFAVFASGRFWQALQGPPFILVCVSWFGLLTSLTLALLADHPRAQLSAAAFFALAGAGVASSSRFGRLVMRAG